MTEPEAARLCRLRLCAPAGGGDPVAGRPARRGGARTRCRRDAALASASCCARRASWRGSRRSEPAGAACRRPSACCSTPPAACCRGSPAPASRFRASARSAAGCRLFDGLRPGRPLIADVELPDGSAFASSPWRRKARGRLACRRRAGSRRSAGGARTPRRSSAPRARGRRADRRHLPALRAARLRPPRARAGHPPGRASGSRRRPVRLELRAGC